MLLLIQLLGILVVVFPQATDGRLYVNGKPCVRGGGIMFVPPGSPQPTPCIDHVDEMGSCWFGDTGFDRRRCIDKLGPEAYANLPRSRNDVDVAPPGFEVSPPGFEVAPPGFEVAPPGFEVSPPGFEVGPPGNKVQP